MSEIAFSNPGEVHTPAGNYSHAAFVPAGADLLFVAGQVGMRPDGTLPDTLAGQADHVFRNLGAVLASHGMGFANIVKLTMFVVAGQPPAEIAAARRAHLGDHRPASTAVFVPQLFAPGWLLEVEAVAARPRAD